MSVDILQEKIRKLKNPSVIDLSVLPEALPPHLLAEEGDLCGAYKRFCLELLETLKGTVGAVRFGFSMAMLLGRDGLQTLSSCLTAAHRAGFYVLLDGPELLSAQMAEAVAQCIFDKNSDYYCDGLVIGSYMGSDILKPFLPFCREGKKDVFVLTRTANKSAPELQDLLCGTRLVHTAAADLANRSGGECVGRCGYSRVGILACASSAEVLRGLRSKYPRLFFLLDGYDYPNSNAKICSGGFDKFGHGAAAVAGQAVTCAWKQATSDGTDYREQALAAAERMKKNITRYITIL